jgi:hypothetical protein
VVQVQKGDLIVSFGVKFAELFSSAIPELPEYDGWNPERLDFSELPLQNSLKAHAEIWVDRVDAPEGFKDPEGHVDYRWVSDAVTLATCELKGPVRPTFFTKTSGNYVSEVKIDWDKQSLRHQKLPNAEHYVGVLAYGTCIAVETQFTVAPVRQWLIEQCAPAELDVVYTEITSPTGRPVTLIMMKVPNGKA